MKFGFFPQRGTARPRGRNPGGASRGVRVRALRACRARHEIFASASPGGCGPDAGAFPFPPSAVPGRRVSFRSGFLSAPSWARQARPAFCPDFSHMDAAAAKRLQ